MYVPVGTTLKTAALNAVFSVFSIPHSGQTPSHPYALPGTVPSLRGCLPKRRVLYFCQILLTPPLFPFLPVGQPSLSYDLRFWHLRPFLTLEPKTAPFTSRNLFMAMHLLLKMAIPALHSLRQEAGP